MSTIKNINSDFVRIINRMVQAVGVKNQSQLVDFLGKSNSTATQWKKRGNIPDDVIEIVARRTNTRENWIKTGEGPMRDEPPEVPQQIKERQADYYSATTQKIAEMVEAMDEETRKDICLSVEKEKLLRELLRQRASDKKAS